MLFLGVGCSSRPTTADAEPSAVPPEPARHEFSRLLMGVQARIVLFHEDVAVAEEAANAAFDRIAGLDAILSDYRVDSEVNRLCTFAGTGEVVPVSDDLFEVLKRSIEFSRASGGAFDVTVGPVVALWREARRSGVIPSRQEIDRAMQSVGWERIELLDDSGVPWANSGLPVAERSIDSEPRASEALAHGTQNQWTRRVRLLAPGMRLDFGGIGKGYACDEALKVLRAFDCSRALVEMGGDIALGDPPPGEPPLWIVLPADEDPEERWSPLDDPESFERIMSLSNCGVGTSGDRFQYIEFDGVRYSHVIDPRTGWGVRDAHESTVIAADATTADALATAVGVLGIEAGAAMVDQFVGARIIE